MKKGIAVIAGVIVLSVSSLAFAQEKGKGMMDGKDGMMAGKGMMGMMGMCQSMMNKPSLVAVGDGVVVLSGKKLYKYDANLNLVKEADIKVEDMGMGKGMTTDSKTPAAGDADEHTGHHPEQK